jgi:hypothetical protein
MAKNGRPPAMGRQPGWMLKRHFMALYAYDRARQKGMKHSSAVTEAVQFLRERGLSASDGQVKAVLHKLRPRGCEYTFLVDYVPVSGVQLENLRRIQAHRQAVAAGLPAAPPVLLPMPFGSKFEEQPVPSLGAGAWPRLWKFAVSFGKAPVYPRFNAKHARS